MTLLTILTGSSKRSVSPLTHLSPNALPGKRRSFSAKTVAVGGPKGTGPFTQLTPNALPGQIQSFSAKTVAVGGPKGTGPFTELSPVALPGGRHVFLPKTVAEVIEEVISVRTAPGQAGYVSKRWDPVERSWVLREDRELLELVSMILSSGILDN